MSLAYFKRRKTTGLSGGDWFQKTCAGSVCFVSCPGNVGGKIRYGAYAHWSGYWRCNAGRNCHSHSGRTDCSEAKRAWKRRSMYRFRAGHHTGTGCLSGTGRGGNDSFLYRIHPEKSRGENADYGPEENKGNHWRRFGRISGD